MPLASLTLTKLFTLFAAATPMNHATKTATATIGAVNRPGNRVPQVKPTAQDAATPTTPTATGHSGGPPQVAWSAVWT